MYESSGKSSGATNPIGLAGFFQPKITRYRLVRQKRFLFISKSSIYL
jgi:hypothetical protein